jgi:hypothetical protein
MDEKIMTLHPEGKQGTRILKSRYDMIRDGILEVLSENGEMSFQEMNREVTRRLDDRFDGRVPWYVVTVKLDLEARGMIERIPEISPQRLRLVSSVTQDSPRE